MAVHDAEAATVNLPLCVLRSAIDGASFVPLLEREYRLPRPVECRLGVRGDNDNYFIWAGPERAQRYVLRLSRTAKHWLPDDRAYGFEVEWLRYAAARGAPIAAPIPMHSGALHGFVDAPEGPRCFVLFPFIPGSDRPLDEASSRAYGESLARVHLASNGFTSSYPRLPINLDFVVASPAVRVDAFLAGARPDDVAFIHALVPRLRPWFEAIPQAPDAYGVIVGDTHGGNKLIATDGCVTLIDSDICGYGWRAYDCAVFRWGTMPREGSAVRWQRFLEGYESVRPLLPEERAAIPWFVVGRQIWLMGAHTVYAQYSGIGWLDERNWDQKFGALRQQLALAEASEQAAILR